MRPKVLILSLVVSFLLPFFLKTELMELMSVGEEGVLESGWSYVYEWTNFYVAWMGQNELKIDFLNVLLLLMYLILLARALSWFVCFIKKLADVDTATVDIEREVQKSPRGSVRVFGSWTVGLTLIVGLSVLLTLFGVYDEGGDKSFLGFVSVLFVACLVWSIKLFLPLTFTKEAVSFRSFPFFAKTTLPYSEITDLNLVFRPGSRGASDVLLANYDLWVFSKNRRFLLVFHNKKLGEAVYHFLFTKAKLHSKIAPRSKTVGHSH